MSNISSARKGRPNSARNTDQITVVGDFSEIVRDWQERTYQPDPRCGRLLDDGSGDVFELQLDSLSVDNWNAPIVLNDKFQIPEGTVIPRGLVPVFRFELKCDNRAATLTKGDVTVDDDARIIDIVAARDASPEEVRLAIDAERPATRVPRKKPVPEQTYRVIERAPNDNASRLGFVAGASEQRPIKIGEKWTAHGFQLASAR